MKKLAFLLIIVAFVSCKKEQADTSEYGISLAKWNSYKATVHNSYSFVIFSYTPIGINPDFAETKITVQNGVIIGRDYTNNYVHKYTETKADLGTHAEGAAAITLDEVYYKAKNVWLKVNGSFITTDSDGLISQCGYIIKGYVDVFTGINVKAITPL